jgi:hypothetical protein
MTQEYQGKWLLPRFDWKSYLGSLPAGATPTVVWTGKWSSEVDPEGYKAGLAQWARLRADYPPSPQNAKESA